MRVTQSMINRSVIKSMNDSKENLSSIQNQISTGKKLDKPSDDPVNFTRSVKYQNTMNDNQQYIDNIVDGNGWMESSENIINQIYELTVDARDRAIQGADDTNGPNERSILGGEVDAILDSAIALGNSTYQNKYIFGGTDTTKDIPFAVDAAKNVSYQGNSEAISRRIYENYDMTINVAGDEIQDSGVFENIKALRDALNSNDTTAINQAITDLNNTSTRLLSTQAHVSANKNQADMTRVRLETANTNLSSYISQTNDTDMAEAIAQYGIEEMAYKAALQTTSTAINLNIMDYLT